MRIAQSGDDLRVKPRLAPHTAINVLGGGTVYDRANRLVPPVDSMARIQTAAKLYQSCRQTETVCRVILSGGNPQNHARAEADVYAPYLLADGVRRSDLVIEDKSRNPFENARNVDELLRPQHYDGLLLITSALHMRRALLAFEGFRLYSQPVIASRTDPCSWAIPHLEGWIDSNSALHEMLGVALYYASRWVGMYR
jgi:uncharacterized SAM-binding protein YcdF (DUF218 family)